MSSAKFEQHIEITQSEQTAAEVLAEHCDLSTGKIKQAMQKGAVWLSQQGQTRRIRRAAKTMMAGDQLHLYYDESILGQLPPAPRLVADEEAYSIWYKPRGLRSQGSKWGDHCTVNRWVELNFNPQRPAFIVHRLDRAATGLIILAHTRQAAAAFSKMFSAGQVTKYYSVRVHGHYPEQPEPIRLESLIDGKTAISHVQCLNYDESADRSLLRVNIETSRKHQIRQHLSAQGFPIVGDGLYGNADDSSDLQLIACELMFECPLGSGMKHYRLSQDDCPEIRA